MPLCISLLRYRLLKITEEWTQDLAHCVSNFVKTYIGIVGCRLNFKVHVSAFGFRFANQLIVNLPAFSVGS